MPTKRSAVITASQKLSSSARGRVIVMPRKAATTKPKVAIEKETALLGLAEFRRRGGTAINTVAKTREELSFSSSKTVPQIRLRPATLYPEIVEEIPEENRVLLKTITSNLTEYRALVILGRSFLVNSGANRVIMDRHPECPSEIVDAQMKAWRAEVRAGAHASTRKHAKQAATKGEETLKFLQRAVKAQEERDAAQAAREQQINTLLGKILESGSGLTADDRKLLERVRVKEGADAFLAGHRRPHEGNLDRTMLD